MTSRLQGSKEVVVTYEQRQPGARDWRPVRLVRPCPTGNWLADSLRGVRDGRVPVDRDAGDRD